VFGGLMKVSDRFHILYFHIGADHKVFSNAVTRASRSLVDNANCVKVYFPAVLPMSGAISGIVDMGAAFLVSWWVCCLPLPAQGGDALAAFVGPGDHGVRTGVWVVDGYVIGALPRRFFRDQFHLAGVDVPFTGHLPHYSGAAIVEIPLPVEPDDRIDPGISRAAWRAAPGTSLVFSVGIILLT
jgi:hypothetical protein